MVVAFPSVLLLYRIFFEIWVAVEALRALDK
jgi:hypothetical protein